MTYNFIIVVPGTGYSTVYTVHVSLIFLWPISRTNVHCAISAATHGQIYVVQFHMQTALI